jgi:hypothetical protein
MVRTNAATASLQERKAGTLHHFFAKGTTTGKGKEQQAQGDSTANGATETAEGSKTERGKGESGGAASGLFCCHSRSLLLS